MKILSINLGNFSSTGGIAQGIKNQAVKKNIEYILSYPVAPQNKATRQDDWVIGNSFGRKCSITLGMITGFNGCFSVFATKKLLIKISKFKPDIIHFHNLHNNYINLPMLFKYIKKHNIKVVWTLHDCWSFTGQCPYFDMINCKKWQTGCHSCTKYNEYPKALVDNTKTMWKLKKKWFNGVKNLTIVTPSQWLGNLVKQSYLKNYPVKVINNGIDLSVFKPTESDFRKKYGLENKKIILGVAFDWGERKGLNTFIELSALLPDNYKIFLVGIKDETKKILPENIVAIGRTKTVQELAQIYTMADVFVNPTREENYPTVNMEAIACGTPIVTFNTGGSPEILDKSTGAVVNYGDTEKLVAEIIDVSTNNKYSKENCLKRAESFDSNEKFLEYIKLYEKIIAE